MKIVSNLPLRVLIVEDDSTDAEFACRSFKSGDPSEFEVVWVGELSDAVDRLGRNHFDVVLLDLGLPGCSGLEALREIRQRQGEVPIIVLTGLSDQRVAMDAIDAGAQDYLIKGQLTVDSLIRSIRYSISRQQLVSAAVQRELAVRWAENLQATMLQSSLDAIISIDHEGNVVEFNPAAENTFGFTRAEMMGRSIADVIIPPRYRQRHRDGLARYLATGQSTLLNQRLELTAIDREGTEFPVELAITRVTVADPPIFTAFLRDVSDRKRAEDCAGRAGTAGHADRPDGRDSDPARGTGRHAAGVCRGAGRRAGSRGGPHLDVRTARRDARVCWPARGCTCISTVPTAAFRCRTRKSA